MAITAFRPKTATTEAPAKPAARSLGFKPAPAAAVEPAPVPVVEIDDEDLPSFLKTDQAGTPPTHLPHRMGFRPPPRR